MQLSQSTLPLVRLEFSFSHSLWLVPPSLVQVTLSLRLFNCSRSLLFFEPISRRAYSIFLCFSKGGPGRPSGRCSSFNSRFIFIVDILLFFFFLGLLFTIQNKDYHCLRLLPCHSLRSFRLFAHKNAVLFLFFRMACEFAFSREVPKRCFCLFSPFESWFFFWAYAKSELQLFFPFFHQWDYSVPSNASLFTPCPLFSVSNMSPPHSFSCSLPHPVEFSGVTSLHYLSFDFPHAAYVFHCLTYTALMSSSFFRFSPG